MVLSSIERRYGFSSTAAGAIAATFDASVLVSVLFISYFGGRGHKPRWLGASLIIQGLGQLSAGVVSMVAILNTTTNTFVAKLVLMVLYIFVAMLLYTVHCTCVAK